MTASLDLAAERAALDAAVAEAVAAGSLPYLVMRVVFDESTGRAEVRTRADQRDMRRAQVALGCDPELDPIGFNRACAWAYLSRTGQLEEMGWADFDAAVAFVIPPAGPEALQTADPTRPAPA